MIISTLQVSRYAIQAGTRFIKRIEDNELTKAIKHPSLLNQFYYKYNSAVGINVAVAKAKWY